MTLSKKNTSNINSNERGGLQILQSEDTEKEVRIDVIDLENDYIKLVSKGENPFPIDIFPRTLQEVCYEASTKYQFALDYLGAGIMSASSTAIGVSHKVKVKHGWEEKANLFTVIVGKPGDSKSHALKFCFKPIHIQENILFNKYQSEMDEYERNILESTDKKEKFVKPTLSKYLISDFTPEALALIHSNNKRGICIYVDELSGWLKNFNRYNNSGEAETYLSFWSGTVYSMDRASGKSLRIEDPYVGVIGSTQITVLEEFSKGGRGTNGFMDRLLFVYPQNQKMLKWNEEDINPVILENYITIISNLLNLNLDLKGDSMILPLNKEAKKYLFNWQNNRPQEKGFLFDYERSIEIKLQQYVIRFALIIQLLHSVIDKKPGNIIELSSVKSAIRLFKYYHNNAIRVRQELGNKNYLETLTKLQIDILGELDDTFKTGDGVKIACKPINGKRRVSERQFKTFIKDKKIFKKIAHGVYQKIV